MRSRPLAPIFRIMGWVTIAAMLVSNVALGANGVLPVTITAPSEGALVGGKDVTVTAEFATPGKKVDALRLFVDGQAYKTVRVASGSTGSASFTWDTNRFSDAVHQLLVELLSNGVSLARASVRVTVNNGAMDVVPPMVTFYFPKDGTEVSGTTRVGMQASDNVGVSYVQLVIDDGVKLITNSSPYAYTWDTTGYANGPHTLIASAYDEANNRGFSKPLTLIVNNPIAAAVLDAQAASIAAAPETPQPSVATVPVAPPVVSLPMAPSPRVEIAGRALPSLVAPGIAPVTVAAMPKIEAPAVPAPSVAKAPASVAPSVSKPAPKADAPVVASVVSIAKPHVSAPAGRTAESVSTPSVSRMASAPKLPMPSTPPALPRAVPMADARIAAIPFEVPGTVPSSPAKAELTPSVADSRPSVTPARPVRVAKPVGEPSVAKTHVAKLDTTAGQPVRMAKAEPFMSQEKPASAPKATHHVDLSSKSAPELVPTAVAPMVTIPKAAVKKSSSTKVELPEPWGVKMAMLPRAPHDVSCLYVVKSGETVESISAKTHVTPEAIRAANALNGRKLAAGDKLRMPMGIRVVMDREELDYQVAPRIENGIAFAPIRKTVENAGGVVCWDAKRRLISAFRGLNQVVLEVGNNKAKLNGLTVVLDAAPYVEDGHTLVPLRFVENSLDIQVQYDATTGIIYMTSL